VNLVRALVVGAAALLLAGGYLAGLAAFFSGTTSQHATAFGSPAIRALSLAVLVACVALACLRQRPEEGEE
jgi:hypothetical protein